MAKAYVFTANGGPEVESFRDLPRPVPGPGQLLVAVRAAGVNPADWKRRTGSRPPGVAPVQLPAVLGGEVAGVVEQLGADVTGFAVGDAVFGNPVDRRLRRVHAAAGGGERAQAAGAVVHGRGHLADRGSHRI